jgi:voltage-gated potassium channel
MQGIADPGMTLSATSTERTGPYQFFMLALCALSLVLLAITAFASLSAETVYLLFLADTVICCFFLTDFLISLRRAPNKGRYFLTWGWLDLVSSIPSVSVLRIGRVARAARIIRVFRGVRAIRDLLRFANEKRAEATLLSAVFMALLVMIVASILVIQLEAPTGNIKTGQDALWWAMSTTSTVGYGDLYPVTSEGRLLGGVLIVVGVGLFGAFTAFVAGWFTAPEEQRQDRAIDEIRDELRSIHELLEKQPSGRPPPAPRG